MSKNEETPSAPLEKAVAESNLSLEARIKAVITEYVDKAVQGMEKHVDEVVAAKMKAAEVEIEQALRKGLGIENDPVIHKSDLVLAIRKAAVENTPKEKAIEAVSKAGPEGNKPQDPLDKMFEKYGA